MDDILNARFNNSASGLPNLNDPAIGRMSVGRCKDVTMIIPRLMPLLIESEAADIPYSKVRKFLLVLNHDSNLYESSTIIVIANK
jgi:hypothetical protein